MTFSPKALTRLPFMVPASLRAEKPQLLPLGVTSCYEATPAAHSLEIGDAVIVVSRSAAGKGQAGRVGRVESFELSPALDRSKPRVRLQGDRKAQTFDLEALRPWLTH